MTSTVTAMFAFAAITLGLGWPIAVRLPLRPFERLLAATVASLTLAFVFAWGVYVFAWPRLSFLILPSLAALNLWRGRRTFADTLRDTDASALFVSQLIVTAWCVGWLATIVCYSGGSWVGDWFGHWQRSVHFLEHGPRDVLFNGIDPLTSRPPLANIVVGAVLALTDGTFATYQLVSTLFGSLAFLPAAALARRIGPTAGVGVLAVLVMVNPMFVQNATFAWTKLPTAFFVLSGIYFFLIARETNHPHAANTLCAVSLAAAILTHYSAGPYVLVILASALLQVRVRRNDPNWLRSIAIGAVAAATLLLLWFGWCIAVYGVRGTFLTNTSVTDRAPELSAQFRTIALNLRDTLVPHFARDTDYSLIAQRSVWGWWRDWFFQLYQVNLLFAFGSVAWLATAVVGLRLIRTLPRPSRYEVLFAGFAIATLGIAVHSGRDPWGLAHICLQPFVLAGIGLLAARWHTLALPWRIALSAAAVIDLCLGIILQFALESFQIERWIGGGLSDYQRIMTYSATTAMNLRAKLQGGWSFFGDGYASQLPVILIMLGVLLILACVRSRRTSAVTPAGTTSKQASVLERA